MDSSLAFKNEVMMFLVNTNINTTIGYYRGSSDNVKIEYNKIYN